MRGQERRPVSWRTLIEVLQDIQLHELARLIEEACPADVMDMEPSFPCRKNDEETAFTSLQSIVAILIAIISSLSLVAIGYWPEEPLNGYMNILKDTYQKQPVMDPDHWLQATVPFINLTLAEGDRNDPTYLSLDEVVNHVTKGSKILLESKVGQELESQLY